MCSPNITLKMSSVAGIVGCECARISHASCISMLRRNTRIKEIIFVFSFHLSFFVRKLNRTWNEKQNQMKNDDSSVCLSCSSISHRIRVRVRVCMCVSFGSGFKISTPVCHHAYILFFTSGFPVSNYSSHTNIAPKSPFSFLFASMLRTACISKTNLTRNSMSQCSMGRRVKRKAHSFRIWFVAFQCKFNE